MKLLKDLRNKKKDNYFSKFDFFLVRIRTNARSTFMDFQMKFILSQNTRISHSAKSQSLKATLLLEKTFSPFHSTSLKRIHSRIAHVVVDYLKPHKNIFLLHFLLRKFINRVTYSNSFYSNAPFSHSLSCCITYDDKDSLYKSENSNILSYLAFFLLVLSVSHKRLFYLFIKLWKNKNFAWLCSAIVLASGTIPRDISKVDGGWEGDKEFLSYSEIMRNVASESSREKNFKRRKQLNYVPFVMKASEGGNIYEIL